MCFLHSLKLLVGHVDAQLLERISIEVFEPEDVEDTNLDPSLNVNRRHEKSVDFANEPAEQRSIPVNEKEKNTQNEKKLENSLKCGVIIYHSMSKTTLCTCITSCENELLSQGKKLYRNTYRTSRIESSKATYANQDRPKQQRQNPVKPK